MDDAVREVQVLRLGVGMSSSSSHDATTIGSEKLMNGQVDARKEDRTRDPLQLKRELEDLTDRLTELQSSLYEIEEARHFAAPSHLLLPSTQPPALPSFPNPISSSQTSQLQPPSRSQLQANKVDALLQALTARLEEFSGRISQASVAVEGLRLSGLERGVGQRQDGMIAGRQRERSVHEAEGVPNLSSGSIPNSNLQTPSAPKPQPHTPSRRRPPRSTTLNPDLPPPTPTRTPILPQINDLLSSLQRSWASLVDREETLREELMEDRLVGVFREGARGAEEAMGSLERARLGLIAAHDLVMDTNPGSDVVEAIETALSAIGSWEQKKKFWVAGLVKCFAILDKNLHSRTTVNGEVLRRHSELSARWSALQAPIAEADALIPKMRRRVGELSRTGNGASDIVDLTEGDEDEGAEVLTDDAQHGGRHGVREPSPAELGIGLGSPMGLMPRRIGSTSPGTEIDSRVPSRARGLTQGSDKMGGRPSFESNSSASPSPARDRQRTRTVSGPEFRAVSHSSSRTDGGSGFMNALRKMSLGGSKAPKASPLKVDQATPSLTSSGVSAPSTSRSPRAASETGSSYIGLGKSSTSRQEPKFSTPKPKWNGTQAVETSKTEYDPSFYVDPIAASPSAGKGMRSVSRRKSGLTQEEGGDRRVGKSPGGSRPASPEKAPRGEATPTPVINRRRSFLPVPTHQATPNRPSSPALSMASTAGSVQPRTTSYGRPSAVTPATGRSRATSTSDVFSTPPPPVPTMPNREQLLQKEARASAMRAAMQTPEPTLRINAARMPFYAGRQSSSGYMPSPSRMPSSSGGGSGLMSPGLDRRMLTPGRTASRQSMGGPPSAFRGIERPGSSVSSAGGRAGASTPLPGMRGGLAFVPNKIDDLDMALSELLDEIPNDLLVERVDPPLRKGHLHDGKWRARYAITTGRNGRREYELRLLILHKPGTGPGGKTQKIMIKDGMVSKDFRLFVLDMA